MSRTVSVYSPLPGLVYANPLTNKVAMYRRAWIRVPS